MGQFPKTLAGVIKVQRLGCAAKTIFDQGPQPEGSIDDDEDFLRPSHTAPERLLLHGSSELQHLGARRTSDDFLLRQRSPARGCLCPMIKPVNNPGFDFMPFDALGILAIRCCGPLRPTSRTIQPSSMITSEKGASFLVDLAGSGPSQADCSACKPTLCT